MERFQHCRGERPVARGSDASGSLQEYMSTVPTPRRWMPYLLLSLCNYIHTRQASRCVDGLLTSYSHPGYYYQSFFVHGDDTDDVIMSSRICHQQQTW